MGDSSSADVVLTGLGCVLAVGDSVHGTAAIRAGLSRPSPSGLVVATGSDDAPAPIKVHACRGFEGFQGLGRLFALLRAAVGDLRRQSVGSPAPATAFVLMPDLEQRPRALELDEELRDVGAIGSQVVKRLACVAESAVHLQHGSRCDAVASLVAAVDHLRSGRAERCLVVAVDSLVEDATLELLYGVDRLQTAVKQDGFFAGEGAAVLQLELADVARREGRRALAAIGTPILEAGIEDQPGEAIVRAIRRVDVPPQAIWSDLNGESWRASDWGHAMQRLTAACWPAVGVPLHTPVASTGDLGAAGIAALLVLATRAAGRRGAGVQLVVAADEEGRRAAIPIVPA